MVDRRMRIKILTIISLLAISLTGCTVLTTAWDSIKDRYKPYEFIGEEEDKVLVKFVFDSPSANIVWLSGQFNGWKSDKNAPHFPNAPLEQALIVMERDPKTGYWTAVLPLSPGRYQYKMVLDEGRVWQEDPNTEHVPDGFGGKNSIIVVIAGSK